MNEELFTTLVNSLVNINGILLAVAIFVGIATIYVFFLCIFYGGTICNLLGGVERQCERVVDRLDRVNTQLDPLRCSSTREAAQALIDIAKRDKARYDKDNPPALGPPPNTAEKIAILRTEVGEYKEGARGQQVLLAMIAELEKPRDES